MYAFLTILFKAIVAFVFLGVFAMTLWIIVNIMLINELIRNIG